MGVCFSVMFAIDKTANLNNKNKKKKKKNIKEKGNFVSTILDGLSEQIWVLFDLSFSSFYVTFRFKIQMHCNQQWQVNTVERCPLKLCWLKIEIPVLLLAIVVWIFLHTSNMWCVCVCMNEKRELLFFSQNHTSEGRKKKKKTFIWLSFVWSSNLVVIYMLCSHPFLQIERFVFAVVICLSQIHRKGLSQQQFSSLLPQACPSPGSTTH